VSQRASAAQAASLRRLVRVARGLGKKQGCVCNEIHAFLTFIALATHFL